MTSSTSIGAVVQASPILFDKQKTIEKIGDLARDAAQQKSNIILFPEVFIPGYPRGLSFGTVVGNRSAEGRELFLKYWENSIEVPSKETAQLGEFAKAAKSYLVVGVTEKDTISDTLFCSLLYFDPSGELLGKHRKLKPTAAERILWGEGDGRDFNVYETPFGKMGGLICWENYMPLARMALYQQGIDIYLAPTADSRDSWQATLTHIACEARCYVLGCNQFVIKTDYPEFLMDEVKNQPTVMCRGGSSIISPLGNILAGPLYDTEGILYAELDPREIIKAKMDFDVVGHYARPDVFDFKLKV